MGLRRGSRENHWGGVVGGGDAEDAENNESRIIMWMMHRRV